LNEQTEKDSSLVQCEVCLKEVPRSEANSAEAQEYVMYFCGVDCYDQWQKGEEAEADTE
jgi:hypothetical protein